jgi:hypothetical protein
MLRVDPEKIEADLAAVLLREIEKTKESGFVGVMARAQVALLPAITRWRLGEINRLDADPNEVANALLRIFSSTLVGEAYSVHGTKVDEDHFQFVNLMLRGIGEECGALLTNNVPGVTVHRTEPTDIGNA